MFYSFTALPQIKTHRMAPHLQNLNSDTFRFNVTKNKKRESIKEHGNGKSIQPKTWCLLKILQRQWSGICKKIQSKFFPLGKKHRNRKSWKGDVRSHINQLRPRFKDKGTEVISPLHEILDSFKIHTNLQIPDWRTHSSVEDEPLVRMEEVEANRGPVAVLDEKQQITEGYMVRRGEQFCSLHPSNQNQEKTSKNNKTPILVQRFHLNLKLEMV